MNEYIQIILNAIMVGIGSAIGSYLSNKVLITILEKHIRKMVKK